ncbi:flagellar hook-associated protein FlgK [Roseibium litorale]|uniref:Flagellar hook-associated protein 1 n=1 Tax=Roseibium litorale TaxID=2803841 RepID=A0ABR9CHY5_9HYPH|nr:flagellar hook-associated protein FlgK [Roseibium litorale]MBD8890430.1 flagellar hook-associated protein FlgK [Roseibium litorale]
MGLTSALNTALFGIQYSQRQIDVAAGNIANADTAGYSTKSVQANVFFDSAGNVTGVVTSDVIRQVDERIQTAYFSSLADNKYADQIANFTDRLDNLIGTLDDGSGLANLATDFANSLSALVNTPGSNSAQAEVVAAADALARQLNRTYASINDLRQDADDSLRVQTEDVNSLLNNIKETDDQILQSKALGISTAELEDQRDRYVEQLSGYLDIRVEQDSNGTLKISTQNAQQLYADNRVSKLSFEATPSLQPGQSGASIMVTTPGGTKYDLIQASSSGSIVALSQLRDDVLVEAQAQLDTIAAEMSLAMSNVNVASTATTVGLESGYTLDLSALQAGNTVSLTYVDSSGNTQNVSFVAVEDASLLPLGNTATARADDVVYGIDISSGSTADYVTQIIAALAATDLNVSDDGSGNLQVLGDTATATTVSSLTANVTVTDDTDQGLGLAVFVDKRAGEELFTDALEKGGQRTGYAASIAVSSGLLADSSQLVTYQTVPETNSVNDSSRAEYLMNALTGSGVSFDPSAGIGSSTTPYEGSILTYINQVISYQGNQASDAQAYSEAKQTLTSNLAIRYEESYSVDVDAEMAFLIQLQNAYAANARVMQTVNELFDTLLNAV